MNQMTTHWSEWRNDLMGRMGQDAYRNWFKWITVKETPGSVVIGLPGPWSVDYVQKTYGKKNRRRDQHPQAQGNGDVSRMSPSAADAAWRTLKRTTEAA